MQKILIILTLALIVLGLHCYALHKRVDYINGTVARLLAERHELIKIINEKEGK
jgi:hypothetical protein